MSTQYPGGFITKSPVAPTTTAASGIWTVDQALQYVKAGTWPSPPIFIEDVFSTYLYTGNGSGVTRSITTGVDSSTYGSLVWIKNRTVGGTGKNHYLTTTALSNAYLLTNTTDAAVAQSAPYPVDPTSTGFNLNTSGSNVNSNGQDYVSWTFRKQPKFFDVVTFNGNATARTIAHNLGSVPGCIIVKCTTEPTDWWVYHRSLGTNQVIKLNTTAAKDTSSTAWNNTAPTSTVFSIGNDGQVNSSGQTYVAYLFAHDAGGFPANGGGSTNGITCGSFTTTAGGVGTVTLGYEPQWVLIKNTTTGGAGYDWFLLDNMRGMTSPPTAGGAALRPNTSDAEATGQDYIQATSTGFVVNNNPSSTYIYIAIRRGPMKTPTSGTSVFSPIAVNAATGTAQTTNFVPDMQLLHYRDGTDAINTTAVDRLRGISTNTTGSGQNLKTSSSLAEGASSPSTTLYWNNTGFQVPGMFASVNSVYYTFQRAPGFFDEVCYTGTGVAMTVSHNLNVVPEIIIVKNRVRNANWRVYVSALGPTKYLDLNGNGFASINTNAWNDTSPTASVFTVGTGVNGNASGEGIVAYLFATLAGISKVGSYTGTAALQTVNCGFTSGARFVLIKRTDVDGDWYTYDSARGISSSTDPYYLMNSTIGEVTGTNYVDTDTTGFKVTAAAPAGLNASGGTYIFLAIA